MKALISIKNELEVGKDRIQEVFNSVLTEIEYELFTKICRKRNSECTQQTGNLLFFACFQIRNLPLFLDFEEENFPKN